MGRRRARRKEETLKTIRLHSGSARSRLGAAAVLASFLFPVGLALLGLCLPSRASRAAPEQAAGQGTEQKLGIMELLATWKDSTAAWATLTREERTDRMGRLLTGITVSDLIRFCDIAAEQESERNAVSGLVRAKLRFAPFPVADLASLIRNPNLQMGCHKEAIAYVSSKRDSFPPEDGRILGDAMLSLADHSSYPPGVRSQIEMAAAYLSSEDSILTRIRAYAGSSSPALQALATDMMAESRDPRANRLLLDQLAKYRKGDVPPPGRLLIAAGMKMKGSAYDALLAIFRETTDAELRRAALQGLAYSGDARAIGLLLEEYGDDQTGIRDSTSSIPDRAELGRYQDLWYCTRLLEPTLIPALLGSDKSLSLQALELIDRESRFGLAAGNEGMLTALRDFAAKADQDTALVRRAVETAGRFQRWEAEKGRGR